MIKSLFLIRVEEFQRIRSLVDFLERTDYTTVHASYDTVGVSPPDTVSEDRARAELDMYLRIWQKIHPGAAATLAD